jgi:hypothetical protein
VVLSGSPTITTPVIAQINDANGNETLKLASIASAVNEVTIENAATGNAVHISATGGDASVGLHLAGKGASGYVNVQDSTDATKRIMFNAAGGTTNTRTMLSSTQTVDRTISLPDATDTLVGVAATQTLTNKTLTSPTITGGALNGTLGATTPSSIAATTGTFSSTLGVTGVATLGNGAILGTPASGTVTNLTGTASININGTVGATTANTGAFTTLTASGDIISQSSVSGAGAGRLYVKNTAAAATGNSSGITFSTLLNDVNTWQITATQNSATVTDKTLSFTLGGVANVANISSTGLAVTGTLSATGNITSTAGTASSIRGGSFAAGVLGTAQIEINNSAANYIDAANTYVRQAGGATIAQFSSTGLAVTGTLSSTTGFYSSGSGGIVQGASRLGIDNNAGAARYYAYGANGTTEGTHEFHTIASDGTPDTIVAIISSTGLAVTGALSCTGALSKGSGSFRIEHPLPSKSATHQLVHSFIEGPKCDLIYRGKVDLVDGKASVNIDADSTMTEGTFEALCATVQCFTSNESGWGAIRGKVIGNILTIEAQDAASTDNVSWMVIGERKDKHIMDTDWTDKNGRPIVEPLKPAEPALEAK